MVGSGRSKSTSQQGVQPSVVNSYWPQTATTSNLHYYFHLSAFLLLLYGFCWHIKASAVHSFTSGFGYFAKYLSFWGFLAQLVALLLSLLSHLFPRVEALDLWADDLSSAVFGHANVIVATRALLLYAQSPAEQPHMQQRPPWLGLLVHGACAPLAWADVLLAHRSFRQQGFRICMLMMVLYVGFIGTLQSYPYPFLDELPEPETLLIAALSTLGGLTAFFHIGYRLTGSRQRLSQRYRSLVTKHALARTKSK
eukprot:jgi/Mesen1/3930/ME000209S02946